MKLYEVYPDCVEINGYKYQIVTDFRDWLKFYDIILNTEIDDESRINEVLKMYVDRIPQDITQAVNALCVFFAGNEIKESNKHKKPVYDFDIDRDYFISGFKESYDISLHKVKCMHWWEFLALFRGMNSKTELKQRMRLRSIDIGQIKDPKEKARIRRAQLEIAIPNHNVDDEIGDIFDSVF